MSQASKKAGCGVLWGLFVVVMIGATVLLVVVLARQGQGGSQAIANYASSIRTGADVDHRVAGNEAERLRDVLRRSTSIRVNNYQGQAGTACFWVTVQTDHGSTPARFVLQESGDQFVVSLASLSRECECPDADVEQPCHLR